MGFFTPKQCASACECAPCLCEIILRMVPRPGSSCFIDFTTDLIRRCGGVATVLNSDDYNIDLTFESSIMGSGYFLHYEGNMGDFIGTFATFRTSPSRDYVLTAYQTAGEMVGTLCPDPIATVVFDYNERRNCDVCEYAVTQEPCECDGDTPVPDAIFTVSGSLSTRQLRDDGPVPCDPWPGLGFSEPDSPTFYTPIESCNSIAGTYIVPCGETLDMIIFNYACDLASGFGAYIYTLLEFQHYEDVADLRIETGYITTNLTFTTGSLMTLADAIAEGLDLSQLANNYVKQFSRQPNTTDCGLVTIFNCNFDSEFDFFFDSGPADNGPACLLDSITIAITR